MKIQTAMKVLTELIFLFLGLCNTDQMKNINDLNAITRNIFNKLYVLKMDPSTRNVQLIQVAKVQYRKRITDLQKLKFRTRDRNPITTYGWRSVRKKARKFEQRNQEKT
jgi:hypothetical protein